METIYEENHVTVAVERIFSGEKTVQELLFALLQKRFEATHLHP